MNTINHAVFMQELSKRPDATFRDSDGKLNYYFHIDVKNRQSLFSEPEKITVFCPEDELLFFLKQIMNYSVDITGELIYFRIV
jgi:hypothetical protein